MSKLTIFNFMTLDGYAADRDGDTSWHAHDPTGEGAKLAAERLGQGNTLLFGRKTYEMMASFWPTPMARQQMPDVAAGMNRAEKIVFSRTLGRAAWEHTTLVEEDAVAATARLKREHPRDLTVLGSGSLLRQFADAGLIDELQLMVDPLLLGGGRAIFSGLARPLPLTLVASRPLANGALFLSYHPAR